MAKNPEECPMHSGVVANIESLNRISSALEKSITEIFRKIDNGFEKISDEFQTALVKTAGLSSEVQSLFTRIAALEENEKERSRQVRNLLYACIVEVVGIVGLGVLTFMK